MDISLWENYLQGFRMILKLILGMLAVSSKENIKEASDISGIFSGKIVGTSAKKGACGVPRGGGGGSEGDPLMML